MEKLFVYGTLKRLDVQKEIIGRTPDYVNAVLDGFTREKILLEKYYPVIISKKCCFVRGLVLFVSKKELFLIDKYETDSYKREKVVLRNNVSVWVYLKNV